MKRFLLAIIFLVAAINARSQLSLRIKSVYYKITICPETDTSISVEISIKNLYPESILIPDMWSDNMMFRFDSKNFQIALGECTGGLDMPPNAKMRFIEIKQNEVYSLKRNIRFKKGALSDSTDVGIAFGYIIMSACERIQQTDKTVEYSQYLKLAENVSSYIPLSFMYSRCVNR